MQERPTYTPLYWLAALGAGGLTVSFFIYMNFMIPHKGVPMATYDFVVKALSQGDWLSWLTGAALAGIILFALLHIKLLVWVTREHLAFKKTEAYYQLRSSNAEVTLMAIPLTLTMTINVFFILGAVFVPGLWSVVEYLFPGALAAFIVTGYYSIKIFMEYFSRLLTSGDFDLDANNNLSQMISIFAFTMVAVGFAAPAAMSKVLAVEAIGTIGAIFFASAAILLILIKLTIGFQSMLKNGIAPEATPSLWIMIPILTLLGITFTRITLGFEHNFKHEMQPMSLLALRATVVSLQLNFGKIGYFVMKQNRYFRTYVFGDRRSVPSFALICPGVAFMVYWFFFVHFGLVHTHIVDKFSLVYFLMLLPALFIHIKTIYYFFVLGSRFSLLGFGGGQPKAAALS
jgi:hypothetical protein